jgi:hypothetical protein
MAGAAESIDQSMDQAVAMAGPRTIPTPASAPGSAT